MGMESLDVLPQAFSVRFVGGQVVRVRLQGAVLAFEFFLLTQQLVVLVIDGGIVCHC